MTPPLASTIAPLIVFDLDGTLVDTAPDLVETLNVILAQQGLKPIDYASARNMVGGGARVMLERGLAAEGRILPAPEIDRLVTTFIAHYEAHIRDKSLVFPDVVTALDRLEAQGCRFAVCTNKLEPLALQLLDAFGLSPRFAAICGQDTFRVAKPDPAILLATIERAGGSAANAIMVGDSITDIATAKAAAVPVIAVDFGYSDVPVADLGPDLVIGHFADLPRAVAQLRHAGASKS